MLAWKASYSANLQAILSNLSVVLGLWIGTRFLHRLRPVEYTYLVLEDGWFESGSFAAWTVAAALFAWAFIRTQKTRKLAYLSLALCALFMALEEISWGQRIVGWRGPEFLTRDNLQGETNLHNLVNLFRIYRPLAAAVAVWTVLPWLLTRLVPRLKEFCDRWAIPIISLRIWPWFFLAAAALADASLPRPHEAGELFLAMAVAVLALDTVISKETSLVSRVSLASVPLIAVLVLPIATAPIVLVSPSPSEKDFSDQLHRLGHRRLVSGWYSQAVQIYGHIVANPEYQSRDDQLLYAIALRASGRAEEAKRALQEYPELSQVDAILSRQETRSLPSPERARGWVLALCVREQQAKARTLSAMIERRERSKLPGAKSALEESVMRYQISVALLDQGQTKRARQELRIAIKNAGRPHTRNLRARFRESAKFSELAGCHSVPPQE